ncbi:GLPGLI family protein [Pedobacter frigoris]|uniref:GLPGLI family protein n=1 Tax=Pedobacter frigoris TaxID=2571272 RepID=UPI00292D4A0B|nr:GLPGLI family protein [Pedobacter frigoris]
MRQLLMIIGTCISISASGQGIFGKKETTVMKTVDSASLKCYYLFSKKKEGADKAFRTDTMVLDIGSQLSKFYDPARLGRDSMVSARMKNIDPATIKSVTVYKSDSGKDFSNMPGTTFSNVIEGESYQIIKDKKLNKITVLDYIDAIGDRFKYEDEPAKWLWKISSETDTVASYTCQKASLSFRGREYTAWFTTDIPVNDGPWKFSGLPGLILKVEDSGGLFSFRLIGLQQLSVPLPIQIDDARSIKCTRAEFEKQKAKQGGGIQINVNAGAVIIAQTPGKFEYIPMELE